MSEIASRYALAFAEVAESARLDTSAAQQQMLDFAAMLAESHELREYLMNPSLEHAGKVKVIDALAARMQLIPQVRNFVAVVTSHDRLGNFHEIALAYGELNDRRLDVADAEITTARPLADDDRASLLAQVGRLAGRQIRATYREDPSLLGGAIVQIGSTVYDGSIRAQFQQLKESMLTA